MLDYKDGTLMRTCLFYFQTGRRDQICANLSTDKVKTIIYTTSRHDQPVELVMVRGGMGI